MEYKYTILLKWCVNGKKSLDLIMYYYMRNMYAYN